MSRPLPRQPPSSVRASVYAGLRRDDGTTSVTVDGQPLDGRRGFRSPAVAEFDWGYPGRGAPTHLALAILSHHLDDDGRARRYLAHFLNSVVRNLPSGRWDLTSADVDAALPADGY